MNNVKFIIIILLFQIIAFNSFAQKELVSDNYFGANFGGTYYRLNMEIRQQSEFVQGYSGGVTFKHLSERYKEYTLIGTIISLNYSEKGGGSFFEFSVTEDSITSITEVPYSLKTRYIELPILATGSVGNRKNRINLYLGPHLGFLISDKIGFSDSIPETGYSEHLDFKTDFGINFGAGIEREIPGGILTFDFLYSQGMSNIYKTRTINNALIYKNQGFRVSISYLLHFNNKNKNAENNKP